MTKEAEPNVPVRCKLGYHKKRLIFDEVPRARLYAGEKPSSLRVEAGSKCILCGREWKTR